MKPYLLNTMGHWLSKVYVLVEKWGLDSLPLKFKHATWTEKYSIICQLYLSKRIMNQMSANDGLTFFVIRSQLDGWLTG